MEKVIWEGFPLKSTAEAYARTFSSGNPGINVTVVGTQDYKQKHEPQNRYYVGSHEWPICFWLRPLSSYRNGVKIFPANG
jgi:hypothetical protein